MSLDASEFYSDVFNCNNAALKSFMIKSKMSILSPLTYSLEVKLNIFLQAFEFGRRIKDPELQVDALLKTYSAKMKTRNRAAIGQLLTPESLWVSYVFLLEDTGIAVVSNQ